MWQRKLAGYLQMSHGHPTFLTGLQLHWGHATVPANGLRYFQAETAKASVPPQILSSPLTVTLKCTRCNYNVKAATQSKMNFAWVSNDTALCGTTEISGFILYTNICNSPDL